MSISLTQEQEKEIRMISDKPSGFVWEHFDLSHNTAKPWVSAALIAHYIYYVNEDDEYEEDDNDKYLTIFLQLRRDPPSIAPEVIKDPVLLTNFILENLSSQELQRI
jgi:hypothetical protein